MKTNHNDWDLNVSARDNHATINFSLTVEAADVADVIADFLSTSDKKVQLLPEAPIVVPEELTVIKSSMVTKPVHPGIYLSAFLIPHNITKKNLQDSLRLTPTYVNDVLTGDKPLTPESALFLERHFKQLKRTAEFWVDLQGKWDLYKLRLTKTFSYDYSTPISDSVHSTE